ncbi:hypothetical protein H072_10533 [Dactylellina haptotyla CBS 200.50]|uniref:Cobalamin-independent methionine synthase MetE C-terminal/archaeal domain-containing protein n=1 Tax=Dactylellina haptotyla (strain CBS 200.50) TaxID=1284197 RepID=S8A4D9_DACHA|nr:hypothetical protein H072_10533 [Dactylellina haptotyla CBS 200.50]
MSVKSNPPFHAEHLGSLLRPQYLLDARDNKELNAADLSSIEDKAIDSALELQRAAGFRTLSDGEYRRHMFYDVFFDNLNGMEEVSNPPREIFKEYVPDVKAFLAQGIKPAGTCLCTGKISHKGDSKYVRQFNYIKGKLQPGENAKMTLAAPEWFHLRHGEHAYSKSVYSSNAGYFSDIAAAYRHELSLLYEAGCRNVQIDDPLLAYFCAQPMLDGMAAAGESAEQLLDEYIKLYQDCLKDKKSDMVVGLHICRGNFRKSIHFSEGGYEHIAKKVFKEIPADVFYLEYDTPRAGTFEPLADVPKDRRVILGLITSKFAEPLEDLEEMKEKVMDAARIMAKGSGESEKDALKRLSVSPQCGFGSHAEGNAIDEKGMKRKLELVVELAKSVWGEV